MPQKILAIMIALVLTTASLFADKEDKRVFTIEYEFDIQTEKGAHPARLWVPIPRHTAHQKVRLFQYNGNYHDSQINRENIYDAEILYTAWKRSKEPKKLHIKMKIETTPRNVPLTKIIQASHKNLPIPKDISLYLEPTAHIPTDGKVLKKAKEITKGIDDRFDKVQAIYDWVTETTFRDPAVVGCGVGDAGKMLESGYFGGKCTDISSLFVAFLRASGIPAREIFGIRVGKSTFSKALGKSDAKGFADITTWQHCRVEYYIPGAGWIPSDPADITKLELVEHLKYHDKRVQLLKQRYLHSWEMNWIGFNSARDFILSPKPEQYPINMLGYPYGEIEDDVLNYYAPASFRYQIHAQEQL